MTTNVRNTHGETTEILNTLITNTKNGKMTWVYNKPYINEHDVIPYSTMNAALKHIDFMVGLHHFTLLENGIAVYHMEDNRELSLILHDLIQNNLTMSDSDILIHTKKLQKLKESRTFYSEYTYEDFEEMGIPY